ALTEVWKDLEVAAAFLSERSLLIPHRKRQRGVIPHLIRSAGRRPKRVLDGDVGDGILLATVLENFHRGIRHCCRFFPADACERRARDFSVRAGTVEAGLWV